METMPSPFMKSAIDLLMHVGSDNYTVPRYLREAKEWGVSKRIPGNSIPEGIVPGVSRLFLWHSEVIPLVRAEEKNLQDVALWLVKLGVLSEEKYHVFEFDRPWHPEEILLPSSFVPPFILKLTCMIQDLELDKRRELEREFKIEWQGAIFSWTYIAKPQFVTNKQGEAPAEVVAQYGDKLDYVNVTYDREWENKS